MTTEPTTTDPLPAKRLDLDGYRPTVHLTTEEVNQLRAACHAKAAEGSGDFRSLALGHLVEVAGVEWVIWEDEAWFAPANDLDYLCQVARDPELGVDGVEIHAIPTRAEVFVAHAAERIERSGGDIWTALSNAGAWPCDPDTGLLTFSDGSAITEAEAEELNRL